MGRARPNTAFLTEHFGTVVDEAGYIRVDAKTLAVVGSDSAWSGVEWGGRKGKRLFTLTTFSHPTDPAPRRLRDRRRL